MEDSGKYDVIVIGGGPAGLSAARSAAEGGLRTLLIEEHGEIGLPLACGEGISVEKYLELKNMPKEQPMFLGDPQVVGNQNQIGSFIERELKIQRFFMGDGGVFISHLDTLVISRPRFDKTMAHLAHEAGAGIALNTSMKNLKFTDNHVEVTCYQNETKKTIKYHANLVTGGDGPAARSLKLAGLEGPRKYIQGVQHNVEGVHSDGLDFYFDHNLTPMGYGWIFPKKNDTNIGIVVDFRKKPREIIDQFFRKVQKSIPGLKGKKIKDRIAGIIPASGPVEKSYTSRYIACGDCAGFANSIFYGGIAIAIHTGQLAGETAVEAHEAGDFSEQFLKRYQEKWKQMPYADPAIYRGHEILYYEISNEELNMIGRLLDGFDITTVSSWEMFKMILKILSRPRSIKTARKFYKIRKGLKISRDWGF